MSLEFRKTTLGELITFSNGRTSPDRVENGQFPVFGSNGLIGKSNESNSPAHSIIVGRVGSYCGSVHYSKKSCWVTDNAIKANAKNNNSSLFLFYLLKHLDLNNWRSGSGQPLINQTTLNSIQVCVPEPKTQQAIAEFIGALDDRITLLRETNATLEAIAQALFKSWFVDFDPVHAKMQGTKPEGMDEQTAALFPDSFEESVAGLVPAGWEFSTIQESFILTMGQSPPGHTYNESGEGIPFYQGRTDFGFRFPSQRIFCTSPTRYADIGDVLVSVRAPVGDVNMALEKCCLGRGVAGLKHPKGYKSFAFYTARGLKTRFDLFDAEGTVFGSINKKDFQELPVIQPTPDVMQVFDEIASPLDSKIIANERQIRTLTDLRDTLLPRLISGQLRVGDVDATT